MHGQAVTIIGCGAQAKYVMEILSKTGGKICRVLDPIGGKVGKRIRGFSIRAFRESDFYPVCPQLWPVVPIGKDAEILRNECTSCLSRPCIRIPAIFGTLAC